MASTLNRLLQVLLFPSRHSEGQLLLYHLVDDPEAASSRIASSLAEAVGLNLDPTLQVDGSVLLEAAHDYSPLSGWLLFVVVVAAYSIVVVSHMVLACLNISCLASSNVTPDMI